VSTAATVVSVLLAAMLAYSAYGKLTRQPAMIESVDRVGFPREKLAHLAVILLAGAAGLLLGLLWAPVGIAAAAGVVAYFVVTVAFHARAGDLANAPKPALIGLFAALALALQLATL
jgi:DoxX-like family